MSLQTDAEQIRELADRIVRFEIERTKLTNSGGKILVIDDDPASEVTLTLAQRQALLAVEDGWKQTIKTISAAW